MVRQIARIALSAILIACCSSALAQRPPAIIPVSADTVVDRLPKGYAALMPPATALQPKALLAHVQQLLETSARTGDFRLAARAEALLSRFPADEDDAAVLFARAYTAQHRHDFATAISLLDEVIALNPRDGEARLSRAQVQLVQGRLDLARSDCAALLGINSADGLLCTASLALRRGDTGSAASLLDRRLAQSATVGETDLYVLRLRAEVAARAGRPDADGWFRRALKIDPSDVRTLAAYARFLRSKGRNSEVEELLASHIDNDGLQLQRTLAASSTNPVLAEMLAGRQAKRYRLAHSLGTQPELRDEAELMLVMDQPGAGLGLALKNFDTQRDFEDVDLLVRAARAADRPDALLPMQKWAAEQQLEVPHVNGKADP